MLHQIVSTALQVADSWKLYNRMRCDKYDLDDDGGKEFAVAWMIACKIRRVQWAYDERQRKKGWNCSLCSCMLQAEL